MIRYRSAMISPGRKRPSCGPLEDVVRPHALDAPGERMERRERDWLLEGRWWGPCGMLVRVAADSGSRPETAAPQRPQNWSEAGTGYEQEVQLMTGELRREMPSGEVSTEGSALS